MARTFKAILVAALAMPLAAFAQDTQITIEDEGGGDIMAPSFGIMGDVGVSKYNRDLNDTIDAGIGYGAVVDLSPMRNVGLELGYRGAVNDLDEDVTNDGQLVTNEVGGNVRLNVVPPRKDLPGNLRPFVFGGAFYHRIDSDGFTPGIEDDINAFALPFGAGVETEIGDRFLVGGRFTYNLLFNEVDALGGDSDNWMATVNLGTRLAR